MNDLQKIQVLLATILQEDLAKTLTLKQCWPIMVTTTKGQMIGLDPRPIDKILSEFYKHPTGRVTKLLEGDPNLRGFGAVYVREADFVGINYYVSGDQLEPDLQDMLAEIASQPQEAQPVQHELLR